MNARITAHTHGLFPLRAAVLFLLCSVPDAGASLPPCAGSEMLKSFGDATTVKPPVPQLLLDEIIRLYQPRALNMSAMWSMKTSGGSLTDLAGGVRMESCPASGSYAAKPDGAERIMSAMGIRFQENRGQLADALGNPRPEMLYKAELPGARIFVRADGISTVFTKAAGETGRDDGERMWAAAVWIWGMG